jgi:hypothetical protein
MAEDNPLDIENIKEKQDEDNDLQQAATKHPEWYSRKTFDWVTGVLCYTCPRLLGGPQGGTQGSKRVLS